MFSLFAFLAAAAASTLHPTPHAADIAALHAADQALLDAIAPGDRALWARTLTDDAVYVDENGAILARERFLKELQPLPAGASGHIQIIDYDARIHGDTALVRHRDDEREEFHGQHLHAEYLMTETWLRQQGRWRLGSVHAYVVPVDPPAVPLPEAVMDAYVGTYAMADLTRTIRREGDHLVIASGKGQPRRLLAETPDVLFEAGQPRTRLIFPSERGGRAARFIDRREGEDLVFVRTSP